jgi:hypothetical protein
MRLLLAGSISLLLGCTNAVSPFAKQEGPAVVHLRTERPSIPNPIAHDRLRLKRGTVSIGTERDNKSQVCLLSYHDLSFRETSLLFLDREIFFVM